MQMEELSKSQIVLLTLLVSFVTSIATGIVTVSLMDQAPPAIAQTVNRVIERTVEKVVPQPAGAAAATVITKEKTVVVKESELISQAVEKISPSLVKVFTRSLEESTFLGLGVVLDGGGKVLVDAAAISDAGDAAITLADGTSVRAFVVSRDRGAGTATLQPATTTATGKPIHFTPAVFSLAKPTLGQTIVVLSGKSVPRITDGLITALIPSEGSMIVDTNVSPDFIMDGSPLIDTEGAIIGVSTWASRSSSQRGFISSSDLVPQTDTSTKSSKEE